MESSVSELLRRSRLLKVLLALTAAHKSLMEASVKPVISTLSKRYTDFKVVHASMVVRVESVDSVELTPVPPTDSLDVQQHPRDA